METKGTTSNLDEIIFENRNKTYGAYFIRKNYRKNLVIALFITIGFFSMSVGTPFILTYISPEVVIKPERNISYHLENIKVAKEEKVKQIVLPKTTAPPSANIAKKIAFAPEPSSIIDSKTVEITDPDLAGNVNSLHFVPDVNSTLEVVDISDEMLNQFDTKSKTQDISNVEEPPIFIGGESEMQKFLKENSRYSEEAKELGLEGKVYVEFVITETGDVTEVSILKSADRLLDQIALRAVSKMPRWIPGKKSGNIVSVRLNVPIVFKIIK